MSQIQIQMKTYMKFNPNSISNEDSNEIQNAITKNLLKTNR